MSDASGRLRRLVASNKDLNPFLLEDIREVLAEWDGLRKDAERYRKLLALHKLGSFCPSEERLDEALDGLPPLPSPLRTEMQRE